MPHAGTETDTPHAVEFWLVFPQSLQNKVNPLFRTDIVTGKYLLQFICGITAVSPELFT